MIQEYIAYLILAIAAGVFIYKILHFFNLTGKKQVKAGNCQGCSTGCEMKELHLMSKRGFMKNDQYKLYL